LPADNPDNIAVRDNVVAVFAAGDTASGALLVVRAIYAGRLAADGIDRWLRKG
jgi:NADPH-dependent glutamate synthase beta subunit-like oxidoreductase